MSRTWFITGTTSGFGRLWTEAVLQRGDRVIAAARRPETLADLADRFGEAILPLRLDVTDREAVFEAVRLGAERFGGIDIALNNAGYGQWGMVEELTETELREQLETNFFGAAWVTQAVLPVFRAQRAGHLIQVTSEGGVRAYPGVGAYHASKWAVEGLSEALAQEVAVLGIHITCLEPGPYATGFGAAARTSAPMPSYDESREANPVSFSLGDPDATVPALFRLVDAPQPPRRLILGEVAPTIIGITEERIRTWQAWEDVSLAAFGRVPTAGR